MTPPPPPPPPPMTFLAAAPKRPVVCSFNKNQTEVEGSVFDVPSADTESKMDRVIRLQLVAHYPAISPSFHNRAVQPKMNTIDLSKHRNLGTAAAHIKRRMDLKNIFNLLGKADFEIDIHPLKTIILNWPTPEEFQIVKRGRRDNVFELCRALEEGPSYALELLNTYVTVKETSAQVDDSKENCREIENAIEILNGKEVQDLMVSTLAVSNVANQDTAQPPVKLFELDELEKFLKIQVKAKLEGEKEKPLLADFVAQILNVNLVSLNLVKLQLTNCTADIDFETELFQLKKAEKTLSDIQKGIQSFSEKHQFYATILEASLVTLREQEEQLETLKTLVDRVKIRLVANEAASFSNIVRTVASALTIVCDALKENVMGGDGKGSTILVDKPVQADQEPEPKSSWIRKKLHRIPSRRNTVKIDTSPLTDIAEQPSSSAQVGMPRTALMSELNLQLSTRRVLKKPMDAAVEQHEAETSFIETLEEPKTETEPAKKPRKKFPHRFLCGKAEAD
uniref:FH2 domain-containing protein n=1 Tax=Caenorhabditis tropicalis TaxID=1561998 RepID=A0A1I7USH0_9PELO